jgi:hypothetical protein
MKLPRRKFLHLTAKRSTRRFRFAENRPSERAARCFRIAGNQASEPAT